MTYSRCCANELGDYCHLVKPCILIEGNKAVLLFVSAPCNHTGFYNASLLYLFWQTIFINFSGFLRSLPLQMLGEITSTHNLMQCN